MTIQMKATEQLFPVVLFIMLHKVILTFESLDEILKYDHSNEGYLAALSCDALNYAVRFASSVKCADKSLEREKWKQQQKSLLFFSGTSYKFVLIKQENQRNKTFLTAPDIPYFHFRKTTQ